MPGTKFLTVILAAIAVAACGQTPDAPSAVPDQNDSVPFRARITFEVAEALPADHQLTAYVVEGNFEDGKRRLVAERAIAATGESPTVIQIDVPRAELSPELGYEMFAVMTDSEGRQLMTTAANRAPVPATGLHFENTFNLRLLPVASPAPPGDVFRLPGELAFDCGELEVLVNQREDGHLVVSLAEGRLFLHPAVATSGGRFSDGRHELWITDELQGFLMMPGESPRTCTRD